MYGNYSNYSPIRNNSSTTTEVEIIENFSPNQTKLIDSNYLPLVGIISKIQSNGEIRIRLYYNSDYRLSDLPRAETTPITGNHGCFFDNNTDPLLDNIRILSPPPIYYLENKAYFCITNKDSVSKQIRIKLNIISLIK